MKTAEKTSEKEIALANAWRSEYGHTTGYYEWSELTNMLAEYGHLRFNEGKKIAKKGK